MIEERHALRVGAPVGGLLLVLVLVFGVGVGWWWRWLIALQPSSPTKWPTGSHSSHSLTHPSSNQPTNQPTKQITYLSIGRRARDGRGVL